MLPVTAAEVDDVLETRRLVEDFAVRKVVHRSNRRDVVATLDARLVEMRAAMSARDTVAYVAADRAFHAAIVASAGNAILTRLYASLRDRQLRMGVANLLADDTATGPADTHRADAGDPARTPGDPRRHRRGQRPRRRRRGHRAPRRHAGPVGGPAMTTAPGQTPDSTHGPAAEIVRDLTRRQPRRPKLIAVRGWVLAVFVYLLAVFHRSSLGVAGLQAEHRFGIGPGELSVFVMLQIGVYAAMQIPTGVLVDRFGPRRLLVAAAVLMGVAQILFALVPSFPMALLARGLLGCGDALTFVSVLRFASVHFPPRRFPIVVAATGMLGALATSFRPCR